MDLNYANDTELIDTEKAYTPVFCIIVGFI